MNKFQARQGDIFLDAVNAVPKGATEATPQGPVILALGEATGHAHAFYDGGVRYFAPNDQGVAYIDVFADGAELRHEEHAPIKVPRGKYRVIRQREYSPEAIRNVAD